LKGKKGDVHNWRVQGRTKANAGKKGGGARQIKNIVKRNVLQCTYRGWRLGTRHIGIRRKNVQDGGNGGKGESGGSRIIAREVVSKESRRRKRQKTEKKVEKMRRHKKGHYGNGDEGNQRKKKEKRKKKKGEGKA